MPCIRIEGTCRGVAFCYILPFVVSFEKIYEGMFRTVMVGVVCFVPSPLWFLPSESITGRFIPSSSSTCLSTAFRAKYSYLITWKRGLGSKGRIRWWRLRIYSDLTERFVHPAYPRWPHGLSELLINRFFAVLYHTCLTEKDNGIQVFSIQFLFLLHLKENKIY